MQNFSENGWVFFYSEFIINEIAYLLVLQLYTK
jgi:hypothetical protein